MLNIRVTRLDGMLRYPKIYSRSDIPIGLLTLWSPWYPEMCWIPLFLLVVLPHIDCRWNIAPPCLLMCYVLPTGYVPRRWSSVETYRLVWAESSELSLITLQLLLQKEIVRCYIRLELPFILTMFDLEQLLLNNRRMIRLESHTTN